MKRNISIVDKYKSYTVEGATTIDRNSLETIINDSIDNIFFFCLEYCNPETLNLDIKILLNKLRLDGSLILQFMNTKKICEGLIAETISEELFLKSFINKKQLISVDKICSLISGDSFTIIKLDHIESETVMIIKRISI